MNKSEAIKAYQKRKANPPNRIRNDELYAGSAMYFYCNYCGDISDVLPESYTKRPKHICSECKPLKDKGWI